MLRMWNQEGGNKSQTNEFFCFIYSHFWLRTRPELTFIIGICILFFFFLFFLASYLLKQKFSWRCWNPFILSRLSINASKWLCTVAGNTIMVTAVCICNQLQVDIASSLCVISILSFQTEQNRKLDNAIFPVVLLECVVGAWKSDRLRKLTIGQLRSSTRSRPLCLGMKAFKQDHVMY